MMTTPMKMRSHSVSVRRSAGADGTGPPGVVDMNIASCLSRVASRKGAASSKGQAPRSRHFLPATRHRGPQAALLLAPCYLLLTACIYSGMHALAAIGGFMLVAIVLWDAFETVILP